MRINAVHFFFLEESKLKFDVQILVIDLGTWKDDVKLDEETSLQLTTLIIGEWRGRMVSFRNESCALFLNCEVEISCVLLLHS